MAATTTLLGLVTPTQGTLSGTWGDTVNYGISDYVDISVAGTLTLTNDGAVTLANTTGSSSGNSITSSLTGAGTVTAQFAIVKVTGTLTVAKVVTGPSYSKTYTVVNSATGGIVTFKASGQTGVSIAVGETAFVYYNGTDYVKVSGTVAVASFQTSLSGLTPSTATTGVVTLAGTLGVASGGTSLATLTANNVILGNGTSAPLFVAPSTSGNVLTSNGTTWQSTAPAASGVTSFTAGTTGFTPSSATSGAVTLAGTLATTNGGTGLTSFTSGGVVYASSGSALATGAGLLFDGTNLGLGVIPSAANLATIQSAYGLFTGNNESTIASNAIYNSGFKYVGTGVATKYYQSAGVHSWHIAASGTAGNAVSFSQTMTLDASGNLLLGATSDVLGNNRLLVQSANTGNNNRVMSVYNSAATSTTAFANRVLHLNTLGSGADTSISFTDNVANNAYIGMLGASLNFAANTTTPQMTLNSTGLGIGTSSPARKLDVVGAIRSAGVSNPYVEINNGTSSGYLELRGSSNDLNIEVTGANSLLLRTNNSLQATLNSSGNLGLGVTPSAWAGITGSALEIASNGAAFLLGTGSQLFLGNNAFYGASGWVYKRTAGASYAYQASGQHEWHTAPSGTAGDTITFTQAMTLNASGNLGVGTTSPTDSGGFSRAVDAKGADGAAYYARSTASGTYAALGHYSTAGGTTYLINNGTGATLINLNGTERARFSSAGGFSVGTTADPGAGAIYATGNITAYYSDARLKTVSGKIENALDKVGKLSGVYYTNNDTAKSFGYDSDEVQVGVLAQDVEAVLPQIVKAAPFDLDADGNSKSGENYKTVQYERLVPLLIEAINELRAEVRALKGE